VNTHESFLQIKSSMAESIIGQETVIDRLLIAILCNGNVLMEGLPGLAKTRAIRTLSKCIESEFRRIQFTPDLLPSDVTGTEVYYSEGGDMTGGMLAEDGFVFTSGRKDGGEQGQAMEEGNQLSDRALQAMWLRRIQTKPADFLRAKFAYQLSREGGK